MEVKNDFSVQDAINAMEARKQSVGLHESEGNLESDDQLRAMWMSLDLNVDEMGEVAEDIIGPMMYCIMRAAAQGHMAHEVIKSVWADAFAIGVLYERTRHGTI